METEKIFSVSISGNIEQDRVSELIQQLKSAISNIDTKNYNLVVEAKDIEITSIQAMISLSQIMSIYKKTDFKNIFAIVNDSLKSLKNAEILKKYINKEIIEVSSLGAVKEKLDLL